MSDYIIKSGENLSRIAKAHGTTVGEIMKNNPQIKDANSIFTGEFFHSAQSTFLQKTKRTLKQKVSQTSTFHLNVLIHIFLVIHESASSAGLQIPSQKPRLLCCVAILPEIRKPASGR